MQKKWWFLLFCSMAFCLFAVAPAWALTDGVYNVSNTTSYANPDTGKTDDGGTNLDIGEAMARSLTQPLMLYEVKAGKQYLTVRIGLSNYISDMRISTQAEKNKATGYQPVPFDVVEENKETDTKEYKFEIDALDLRVKLTFFVEAMNRDVIFFITPDPDTKKVDSGAFAASDKAAGGYSSGFAGGLTGGNAEDGKMPALVEQLTGVSHIEPSKDNALSKEATQPESAMQTAETKSSPEDNYLTIQTQPSQAASGSPAAEPALNPQVDRSPSTAIQSPEPIVQSEPLNESVKPKAEPVAAEPAAKLVVGQTEFPTEEKTQPVAVTTTIAETVEEEGKAAPMEEKLPVSSTVNSVNEGLTQFDREGNQLEQSVQTASSMSKAPVAGIVLFIMIAAVVAGYWVYRQNKK